MTLQVLLYPQLFPCSPSFLLRLVLLCFCPRSVHPSSCEMCPISAALIIKTWRGSLIIQLKADSSFPLLQPQTSPSIIPFSPPFPFLLCLLIPSLLGLFLLFLPNYVTKILWWFTFSLSLLVEALHFDI